jgi:hypothetical protein
LNGLTPAAGQAISSLEIGDLVSVTKTYTTGSPGTVTETMYVESIAHEINPATHRIRFSLGQAKLLQPFVLDQSELDDPEIGLT